MSDCVLAVDQGTSSTKSVVFSRDGEVLASASAPLATAYGADGTAEQDPEEIFRSVIAAVGNVVEELETKQKLRRDAIACAGIANQRATFVLWDDIGEPLHDAVVWQCKRSIEICNELKTAGAEHEVIGKPIIRAGRENSECGDHRGD